MKGERYLTRTAQYGAVYRKGSSWGHPLLVMKALPNGLEFTRCGLSVSKRVGKAVVRNRVKRQLREILRQIPLRPGWDIVFIVRPAAAGTRFAALEGGVKGLLTRARILSEECEKACPGTN